MTKIVIDKNKVPRDYVPFWKKCISAGRAVEGLRENWRNQLRSIQNEIGFEYIRFHNIFGDEMFIYNEDEKGNVIYNFQYVDELFDFLKSQNIKPVLELGFMPSKLATKTGNVFWWKGNGCPPNDFEKWSNLIVSTINHFIERYGINEVRKWYFEIWNEPNLSSFWSGTKQDYFELYKCSLNAIKSIDNRLKVGGPSTSGADFRESEKNLPYMQSFIDYCEENSLPIDFFSAHPYPTNWAVDGENNEIMGYMEKECLKRHLDLLNKVVDNSSYAGAEIIVTEWNSSPSSRDLVHDTAFMAPFIIENNVKNLCKVDALSFWCFTDVFEEEGAGLTPFHGGFGLVNFQGIKKSSYFAYYFLGLLGDKILEIGDNFVVTKSDEKIQILLWNYCHYKDSFAKGDRSQLTMENRYGVFDEKYEQFNIVLDEKKYAEIYFISKENCAFDIWAQMGCKSSLTEKEVSTIKKRSLPEVEFTELEKETSFTLNPHDVAFIEFDI